MKLYATGFNAWGQLNFQNDAASHSNDIEPDDLHEFTLVYEGDSIESLVTGLTYTQFRDGEQLHKAGVGLPGDQIAGPDHLRYAENGIGEVLGIGPPSSSSLSEDVDRPGENLVKFPSRQAVADGAPAKSWPCKRPVRQIVAFDAGFAVLYDDGSVATMGDARFADCLGRVVDDESPADEPGDMRDLRDLNDPVQKIAAGGYTILALTASGGIYAWGRESAGTHRRQQAVPDLNETPNYIEVDEDKDVKDVAVGESHAICLTTDNRIYVIGDNENGQLGLGQNSHRITAWTGSSFQVPAGHRCIGVAAGPRSSFLLIDTA